MFKAIFVIVIVVLSISTYLAQENDKKTGKVTSAKEVGRSSGNHIVNLLIGIGEGFREGYKNNSDSIMNASNRRLVKANRDDIKKFEQYNAQERKKEDEQLKNYVRQ